MYNDIKTIPFEGPKSKNPFSFRYYDKNRVIAGKTMAEHLRFALSWWHTCCAAGTDMFGGNTMDKTFGKDGMELAKAKVDFAFDLMQKLGIEFYCFHDVDVAPEGETLAESIQNLEIITDYLLEKQNVEPDWFYEAKINLLTELYQTAKRIFSENFDAVRRNGDAG